MRMSVFNCCQPDPTGFLHPSKYSAGSEYFYEGGSLQVQCDLFDRPGARDTANVHPAHRRTTE